MRADKKDHEKTIQANAAELKKATENIHDLFGPFFNEADIAKLNETVLTKRNNEIQKNQEIQDTIERLEGSLKDLDIKEDTREKAKEDAAKAEGEWWIVTKMKSKWVGNLMIVLAVALLVAGLVLLWRSDWSAEMGIRPVSLSYAAILACIIALLIPGWWYYNTNGAISVPTRGNFEGNRNCNMQCNKKIRNDSASLAVLLGATLVAVLLGQTHASTQVQVPAEFLMLAGAYVCFCLSRFSTRHANHRLAV